MGFLLSCFIINSQTINNGSFEINDGITGWSGWNNATVSHSTTEGVSSLGAAKLINNSTGSSLVQVIPNPTFESGASKYRLQFKVKGTAGNKFRAVIIYTDPNNVITGDTYMTETTLGSDDWEEYHQQSTLKAGYDGTELTLRLQGRTNGGTLYFDDVIYDAIGGSCMQKPVSFPKGFEPKLFVFDSKINVDSGRLRLRPRLAI